MSTRECIGRRVQKYMCSEQEHETLDGEIVWMRARDCSSPIDINWELNTEID